MALGVAAWCNETRAWHRAMPKSNNKICQLYFQLNFSHNYFLVVFSSWGSDNSNGFQHKAMEFSLLLALTMLNALN